MPRSQALVLILSAMLIQPVFGQTITPNTSANTIDQADPDAIKNAAKSALNTKNWSEALRLWKEYVVLLPNDAQGHRMLGWSLREHGQVDDALAAYRRAIEVDPGDANGWNGLCWTQLTLKQPNAARPNCEKATELAPDNWASIVNLGHTYLLEGVKATAWSWYEKALPFIESEDDLNDGPLADFDLFIGKNWLVEDSKAAKSWFKSESHVWLERWTQITKLHEEAIAAEETDDYVQAVALREQRLSLLVTIYDEHHPIVRQAHAALITSQAHQYIHQQRYDEAEPLYRRVLTITEKVLGPNHANIGTGLNNLALLLQTTGRYDEAEPLHRRALAITEKALGPNHADVGNHLSNLALLLNTTGRYGEAEPLYRRALAITEKSLGPDHADVGIRLNNLAFLLQTTGRYGEAEPLYRRTLAITEKALGTDHARFASSLDNLAGLLQTTGRYDEAEPLHRRALAITEKALGTDHADVGIRLNNLASLLNTAGRYDEAEPLLRRSYRISLNAGHPEVLWNIQLNLLKFHASNAPVAAIFYGKQAVNTLQMLRGNLKNLGRSTQVAFLGKVERAYQYLADLLIQHGRLPEAQQVLAMLKEEEYYDFIRRDATADSRSTRAAFTGQESPWDEKLQAASGHLTALGVEVQTLRKKQEKTSLTEADAQRLLTLERELESAGAAFIAILDSIQVAFTQVDDKARYAELEKKGLDNDLTDVLASFGPDVALLQYVVMPEDTHILLTTGATRLARKANVKQETLNQEVQALLKVLHTPSQDPRPAAQALYQRLIGPVVEDLKAMGAKTLMLSLDGVLRYAPMAALHDGKQYLAQRFALALYTDAARERLKDVPRKAWKVAGLGLTQAKEGFDALPAVKGEMAALVKTPDSQGVLPGIVKLDEQFTPTSFKETLRERFPVLHIASHFNFSPAGEADSFLLLGDGSKLSLNAIRTGGYSFTGVDLMTLSACQTGVGGGKDANGREIEGLGVLVQKQGAKGVIATLWPVADESTGLFMREFYQLREANKLSKAEALRQAQLALLSGKVTGTTANTDRGARKLIQAKPSFTPDPDAPFAHPFFWAPFILMGNWL